jgi:predicted dehydrogenase
MRIIVIGCLGSMGRRRIRNLKVLGITDIIGYDVVDYKNAKPDCWYTDMLDEVENFLENPTGLYKKVDGIIVSVPPLQKQKYIDLAAKYRVHVFCEADVKTYTGNYRSSATMRLNPAIQKIKEILNTDTIGKIYTFTFHCGNNLYDWHPGTEMSKYYAATKETGGCLEIFPFELSWLSMLFGTPVDACGMVDKKLDDKDIKADDVIATTVKFEKIYLPSQNIPICNRDIVAYKNLFGVKKSVTGTVLVDIVSRPAIRELRIVGEKCNLFWNWDYNCIELEYPNNEISMVFYPKGNAAEGYNSNICEEMYVEEMRSFINSITPCCGECEYATPKENHPKTTHHLCKKYNKQLLHRNYHPDLCKLTECKEYYYPKEDEEACMRMLKKIGG